MRVDNDGYSRKTKLQNEEIVFRFVNMLIFPDLDDKREWLRILTSSGRCQLKGRIQVRWLLQSSGDSYMPFTGIFWRECFKMMSNCEEKEPV